jgi:two-component system response regulator HydG
MSDQPHARVLVVDDERDVCEFLEASLTQRGVDVLTTTRAESALEIASNDELDVVLSDLRLDHMDGLELCRRMAERQPNLPVVLITGDGSLDAAVGAIRAGAYDFITKPIDIDALEVAIQRAARHRRLTDEVHRLRDQVAKMHSTDDMVGGSGAIRRVRDLMERIGPTDATVLIAGESGTGKELVARGIHDRSDKRRGEFVAINCAAVAANLLESELFGHVKGAFTDARADREGLFVRANDGTLFLDEIGEMPLEMQVKLLRALQARVVRPVGGNEEITFNTRIIAATNRDLEAEIERGRFREDLYYRINVVRIDVPPLRDRGNDILLLAQHFIDKIAARTGRRVRGVAPATARKLLAYDWPGNVRELENSMERAVALAHADEIGVSDLPSRIIEHEDVRPDDETSADTADVVMPLNDVERRHILRALRACNGNKTQAARLLGLDRRTLYRKLDRYDAEATARDRRMNGHAVA